MLSTNLSEYKEQLDFFNKEFVKKDDTIRNLSREIVSIRNELSKKTDDGRKVFICNERISNLEKLLKEKDIVISSLIKELEKNKIAVSISSHLQPVLANSYRERVKQLHE
jgi:predicted RNase H-like nuclease (RuvC/YqgF family)